MKREVFYQVVKLNENNRPIIVLGPCSYDDFIDFYEYSEELTDKELVVSSWEGNTLNFWLMPKRDFF